MFRGPLFRNCIHSMYPRVKIDLRKYYLILFSMVVTATKLKQICYQFIINIFYFNIRVFVQSYRDRGIRIINIVHFKPQHF